jgi:tetratricopeptide (TPR) repeat protein
MDTKLLSLIDGVLGNAATDGLKRVVHVIRCKRAPQRAIAATEREFPFQDVNRCLTALVENVDLPDDVTRGDHDIITFLADAYIAIARQTGVTIDHATALQVISAFCNHIDQQSLDLATHDERDRRRNDELKTFLAQEIKNGFAHHSAVTLAADRGIFAVEATEKSDSEADNKLVVISTLINTGQFVTASKKLGELDQEVISGNDTRRYKFATFTAICAYESGDDAAALIHFQQARTLRPGAAEAVSNLAAAYLAVEDGFHALEEARSALALDSKFGANYVAALHYLQRDNEVLAYADSLDKSATSPDTLLALARCYIDFGRYAEAEEFATCAVERSDSEDVKEALAVAMLGRHDFARLSTPDSVLTRAEQLLTDAIQRRRGWQYRDDVARYQMNRAVVRALRRDYERALRDVDDALEDRPVDDFRFLRARLLTSLERRNEALVQFQQISAPTAEMRIAHAHCLVGAGRYTQALAILDDAFVRNGAPADVLSAVHVGLSAASGLNDRAVADRLLSLIPDGDDFLWTRLAARGYLRLRFGEIHEAIEDLQNAEALAPATEALVIRANVARACERVGRWSLAIEKYRSFATPDSDQELVDSLGTALFHAEKWSDLVALYDGCVDRGRVTHTLRELRARVYERIGDLPLARQLFIANATSRDGSSDDYVHAAHIACRTQSFDVARELLGNVSIRDVVSSPRLLAFVAQVQDAIGENPLQAAYLACVLNRDAPDIPAAYAVFFHRWWTSLRTGPSEETSKAGTVSCGTAVTVKVLPGTSQITIIIADDPTEIDLPGHVQADSPRGRALIGRKIGDRVALPSDSGSTEVEIIRAEHRYSAAFREAVENSPSRFGRAALVFPVDDGAHPIFGMDTQARRERCAMARAQYHAQKLSLGAASDRARMPPIAFYCKEMFESPGAVQGFTGNAEDAGRQRAALVNANEVILDLTSLITLSRLKIIRGGCRPLREHLYHAIHC